MYSSHNNNIRPVYRPTTTRVRITKGGPALSVGLDGVIDLYPLASKIFGVLNQNNIFTGTDNVFEHIQAKQMHFVSDPRMKNNITPIDSDNAIALIRSIAPYTYDICNAGTSAGFMADMVPPEFTHVTSNGIQSIDYNAMFTNLWAAVQYLDAEVTYLKGISHREKRKVVPSCPPTPNVTQRRATM
jgi:hypothetical protein